MRPGRGTTYLLGATLVVVGYFTVPGMEGNGFVFSLIGLSAAAAIVVGAVRNRPDGMLPWLLFAAAQVSFVVGDLLYYAFDFDFPSLGDVFYLATYPLLVSGLVMVIRARTPGRDRASLLDASILTLGLGLLAWVFLIEPYTQLSGLTLVDRIMSMAYPLMDILLLAVFVRLAVGAGRRPASFYLVAAGIVSLLATDAAFGFIELHNGYNQGGLLDAGWLAYYILWGTAALHPDMRRLTERTTEGEPRLTGRRLVPLAVATLIAPVVGIVQSLKGPDSSLSVPAATSAVLFLLVLARMNGLIKRRSDQRTAALIRNAADVVIVLDSQLVVRFQTDSVQRVLKYDPTALEGRRLMELIHPEDQPNAGLFFAKLSEAEGPSRETEFRVLGGDGSWLRVETVGSNLLDDPDVQGVVVTMRDISRRIALQDGLRRQVEELEKLDQIKGELVSTVSHELRTPLTTLVGHVEMLRTGELGDLSAEQKWAVEVVDRSSQRLLTLIEDLLTLAKIEKGGLGLTLAPTDLGDLTDELRAAVALSASARSINLVFDVDPGVGDVLADRSGLARALLNLLTNAIKFTPEEGLVRLAITSDSSDAVFSVSDTGIGMSPEDQARVFTRFFRSSNATEMAIPGTGLGLSIVKKIVDDHGGTIGVESELGAGTTVIFTIPLIPTGVRAQGPSQVGTLSA